MATRTSTEYGGLGQSGYTAGRRLDPQVIDRALERELATEPTAFPRGSDEAEIASELGTDDRFSGRGGPPARML